MFCSGAGDGDWIGVCPLLLASLGTVILVWLDGTWLAGVMAGWLVGSIGLPVGGTGGSVAVSGALDRIV